MHRIQEMQVAATRLEDLSTELRTVVGYFKVEGETERGEDRMGQLKRLLDDAVATR